MRFWIAKRNLADPRLPCNILPGRFFSAVFAGLVRNGQQVGKVTNSLLPEIARQERVNRLAMPRVVRTSWISGGRLFSAVSSVLSFKRERSVKRDIIRCSPQF
jgi:hypothetical protein